MQSMVTTAAPEPDWRLAAVLLALVLLAVATSLVARIGVAREQVVAAIRAVLQLAAVSLVIAAVLSSLAWSAVFVLLMFVIASATATGRVGAPRRQVPWVASAVAAGAAPVIALCLGSGVIPLNGAGVIPICGIVIGNMMTAATLAGRRAFDELATHRGPYEAALALGLPPHEAAYLVIRPSAREALLPGLDQTRTVGLVSLPGAFIGVLLGGGTPLEAGAAQVLVLFGVMAGQVITVAAVLRLVGHGRVVRRLSRPGGAPSGAAPRGPRGR